MEPAYQPYLARVLLDEATLQARIAELGTQISTDYQGQGELILVCILKGGVLFMCDLMRHITLPHTIEFMAVSSYGVGKRESSGHVRILMDLALDIRDKHVLIVEDIIDSGHTLAYITRQLEARRPSSLGICTLLSKPSRREIDITIKYLGFEIPNEFVFGYGLDLDEKFRNLPFVGIVNLEAYRGTKG
ncbi:MAG: hypoxanthine phosphoribosyltransferase [Anaerolineae bacterium]|nr:hypoxanthine phosphoribosyltransferase [Anaerolineae bacterium]